MTFRVEWTEKGRRCLQKLEPDVVDRVVRKTHSIAENPFRFVEHLEGYPYFKLRIGDYRVILDIRREDQVVDVLFLGHRKKVYKEFSKDQSATTSRGG